MQSTITVELSEDVSIQMTDDDLAKRLVFAREALEGDYFVRTAVYKAFLGIDDHDLVIGKNTDPDGRKGAYIVESDGISEKRPFSAMSPSEYARFVEEFPRNKFFVRAYLLNNPQINGKDMLKECGHIVGEHMLGGKPEIIKAEYANWPDRVLTPEGSIPQSPTIDDIAGWATIHKLWANPRAETFYRDHFS